MTSKCASDIRIALAQGALPSHVSFIRILACGRRELPVWRPLICSRKTTSSYKSKKMRDMMFLRCSVQNSSPKVCCLSASARKESNRDCRRCTIKGVSLGTEVSAAPSGN